MSNIENYAYFALIYKFLQEKIETFGLDLMSHMMGWAGSMALTLVALWLIIQGFRIITGQSREPMMVLVVNASRITMIVTAATAMAIMGTNLHDWFTSGLDQEINGLFTGNSGQTTAQSIDKNLAYTQVALSTIDAVQVVPGDTEMQTAKTRAQWVATLGTASPPMMAAGMLLMYQFAMALFIGLGPLFILCLIFDQTKDLFRRWLMYGIGTLFAMATLSAVCALVLDLTVKVSTAYWFAKITTSILGSSAEGLTSQALQQGGIGLLMTGLIVTVPRMAANFFQGTLGEFMHFSVFGMGGGLAGRPGPQGQPAGSYGPASPTDSTRVNSNNSTPGGLHNPGIRNSPGVASSTNTDQIKPYDPRG